MCLSVFVFVFVFVSVFVFVFVFVFLCVCARLGVGGNWRGTSLATNHLVHVQKRHSFHRGIRSIAEVEGQKVVPARER